MSESVVPNGFSSTSKQMILNNHFALNTVFREESFSVDALALRHDCFKIGRDVHLSAAEK